MTSQWKSAFQSVCHRYLFVGSLFGILLNDKLWLTSGEKYRIRITHATMLYIY